MDGSDGILRLRSLQADLVAFSESRLPNLERLWTALEASIGDFRSLLDKHTRNDASRQQLNGDKITIRDVEYSINDEFRQEVIQVADALDLDELQAAQLYLDSHDSAIEFDRPPALTAIFEFHGRREALLDCMRLALQQAIDLDADSEYRQVFAQLVHLITSKDGLAAGPAYWARCLTMLADVEMWLARVRERLQAAVVLGQNLNENALEALQYQQASLLRQHESLALVCSLLVKDGHANMENYRALMTKTAALQDFDIVTLHHVPILLACAVYIAGPDGPTSLRDCRALDKTFSDKTEKTAWKLTNFRAFSTAIWLAEYSGRYNENAPSSPLQDVDLDLESQSRADRFMDALRDGAFHFLLLICAATRLDKWHNPAKAGLMTFLLGNTRHEQLAEVYASDHFADQLCRQLQTFVDALITNMPDTIRRLKHEEDLQRRNAGSSIVEARQDTALHLERFLVIVAYAFQDYPEAAQDAFWSDLDGNMYGFLQWASKRQSTPRAAAFCEMFQAISGNQECAESAQQFLLEEAVGVTSARIKKGSTLSWSQIFDELTYYAARLQENPGALTLQQGLGASSQVAEPESSIMLECYLRLAAHMCRQSPSAREFLLAHPDFQLHSTLLDLMRSSIGSRFKACACSTLTAMLTDKQNDVSVAMWECVDAWVYGGQTLKLGTNQIMSSQSEQRATATCLDYVADGFETANSFVLLLHTLILPCASSVGNSDSLPFPEQLGMAYRMPGIDQYVDYVLERVFVNVASNINNVSQLWELRASCLSFITTCLSTFNEDLVSFANMTQMNVDAAMATTSLAAYARLHPFSRVMEWMFNNEVIAPLFAATHVDVETVNEASPDTPLVTALTRGVEAVELVLRLQATYFDIVRPIVKTQAAMRSKQVANPAFACFEDVIASNLKIITDVGLYCGTGHEQLTIVSLRLLTTLSNSRRFASQINNPGHSRGGNRLLTLLQQEDAIERIAASLTSPLRLDARELEMGSDAPGFVIKQAILSLLSTSLQSSLNSPVLAHGLLGFTSVGASLVVGAGSRFEKGMSLFHVIARLYAETVGVDPEHSLPWLTSTRRAASEVIRLLIRSSLTQELVLTELRDSGFFESVAMAQEPLKDRSTWAGQNSSDPDFLSDDASAILCDFLSERLTYFEQGGHRLRLAKQLHEPTQVEKIRASFKGLTTLETGEQVSNASLFDLLDFVDLDITPAYQLPEMTYMSGLDFGVCRKLDGIPAESFNLVMISELLRLREAELAKSNRFSEPSQLQRCRDEAEVILLCLSTQNRHAAITQAQEAALRAWVDFVTMMVDVTSSDGSRSAFVMQALQLVLPKLDQQLERGSRMTLPMARLVFALVRTHAQQMQSDGSNDSGIADDSLLHAFRTSLHGIVSVTDDISSREIWYQIAFCILDMSGNGRANQKTGIAKQALKLVEHGGERLLDGMCEDALSSTGKCRMAVLLMLGSCVRLFQAARSTLLIRLMMKLNFVSVLVDSIRGFADDFEQDRESQGMFAHGILVDGSLTFQTEMSTLLASFQAGLTLLLQLSQDNEGATALLETGIFSAIRESQLFAADPDIGLDVENPKALDTFYQLLGSLLRIITSIVIVKGKRNQQTLAQGRAFLAENRTCMQSVFKAANRKDMAANAKADSLEDLVDNFTVLINATEFLGVSLTALPCDFH